MLRSFGLTFNIARRPAQDVRLCRGAQVNCPGATACFVHLPFLPQAIATVSGSWHQPMVLPVANVNDVLTHVTSDIASNMFTSDIKGVGV